MQCVPLASCCTIFVYKHAQSILVVSGHLDIWTSVRDLVSSYMQASVLSWTGGRGDTLLQELRV